MCGTAQGVADPRFTKGTGHRPVPFGMPPRVVRN
ncbi:predicted protein [Streptomyces filamentosus NRRL 15998]|uniref:Predicted protein n=1 Tax=Streptomyces filamentosus NRRL 15998 TaxID=457431 RepID=D6AT19_STRFL|nr:predicted protein [Streptomyces filamentosus NRRL 15998]